MENYRFFLLSIVMLEPKMNQFLLRILIYDTASFNCVDYS